jgi:hypothetical protein
MKTLELENANAIVIVAHPDDETIWMGGTILKFNNVRWHILSLCRGDDNDRAPKFKKVCDIYKAKSVISDLEDEGIMNIKESLPDIGKRIDMALKHFKCNNFKYLFTHGYRGEYGHLRHQGVNRVVKEFIKRNKILVDRIFQFSYKKHKNKDYCIPNRDSADFILNMSPFIFQNKKDIIEKEYGFSRFIFEYKSCSPIETFRLAKIL